MFIVNSYFLAIVSCFYRFIAASMDLDNFVSPAAGMMTPYTAVFILFLGT
jgi:glucose uptake protein